MTLSFGIGEYSYGYLSSGERVLVSNTTEQIAAFIMAHKTESVKIVNVLDLLEIETSMGFLMTVTNQHFLVNELLPVLTPMQEGEVEAAEFIPYTTDKYLIKNVRLERKEDGKFVLANIDHFNGVEVHEISEYFNTEQDLLVEHPNSITGQEAYDIALEKGFI